MHQSAALSILSNSRDAKSADGIVKQRRLSCDGVVLDLDRRRGLVRDVDLGLSAAEFAMVHLLFVHRGVPMSKEAISAELPVQVDPRMVDVYVSRARAKLAAAGMPDTIMTVWGRGYMVGDSDEAVSVEPPTSRGLDATLVPA